MITIRYFLLWKLKSFCNFDLHFTIFKCINHFKIEHKQRFTCFAFMMIRKWLLSKSIAFKIYCYIHFQYNRAWLVLEKQEDKSFANIIRDLYTYKLEITWNFSINWNNRFFIIITLVALDKGCVYVYVFGSNCCRRRKVFSC